MVLSPPAAEAESPVARITVTLTDAHADSMSDPQLEALRTAVPAARSLPLLRKLARRETGVAVLDYLGAQRIAVEVSAWR